MKRLNFLLLVLVLASAILSCHDNDKKPVSKEPAYKEEAIIYSADSASMNGLVVFDSVNTEKRPVVLVVHEWWGINDYIKKRVRELAALGYFAVGVDMYGNGKLADNPDSALSFAMPFYRDPVMAKARFDAAIAKISTYSQADTSRMGAIGYCFGGNMVLNFARLGANVDGVVSFHGSLLGTPADKALLKAKILVCHGGADPFVPAAEIDQFKKQMDSIGANYSFKVYDSATHAFTNPDATATGKKFNMPISYNAKADTASWNDMKVFFEGLFKK
jgi:dienelactone hydrolase